MITVSIDEKPGVQAIDTAAPGLPPRPECHILREIKEINAGPVVYRWKKFDLGTV